MSPHEHTGPTRLRFAIVTVSDSRTRATDEGGDLAERLAKDAGHDIIRRDLVRDDVGEIAAAVRRAADVDVVVLTGGTGISPRDVTPEAVRPLLERELPGFGETFRAMSFAEVGGKAWSSRALAGVAGGRLVFALPGSPKAVRLAMEKLVLPESPHLVGQLRR